MIVMSPLAFWAWLPRVFATTNTQLSWSASRNTNFREIGSSGPRRLPRSARQPDRFAGTAWTTAAAGNDRRARGQRSGERRRAAPQCGRPPQRTRSCRWPVTWSAAEDPDTTLRNQIDTAGLERYLNNGNLGRRDAEVLDLLQSLPESGAKQRKGKRRGRRLEAGTHTSLELPPKVFEEFSVWALPVEILISSNYATQLCHEVGVPDRLTSAECRLLAHDQATAYGVAAQSVNAGLVRFVDFVTGQQWAPPGAAILPGDVLLASIIFVFPEQFRRWGANTPLHDLVARRRPQAVLNDGGHVPEALHDGRMRAIRSLQNAGFVMDDIARLVSSATEEVVRNLLVGWTASAHGAVQ
jgi:hypothetical protein